jgi:hypothetical protein
VEVLLRKVAVQEDELRIAEMEVAGMLTDLKAAMAGVGDVSPSGAAASGAAAPATSDPLDADAELRSELDALARQKSREAREASAEDKLAELKRRMGK